jgi:HPt (histidine-containing phosphotransfer) domain-containing protein
MVQAFVDNADQRLLRMIEAREASDLECLEREAHSLAGAAANFGAMRLADQARHIMATCRSTEPGVVAGGLADLSLQMVVARRALSHRFLDAPVTASSPPVA